MSGLSHALLSSAAPSPARAPWRADRPANRSVARDFAAGARRSRSSPAGRSQPRKKIFPSDYPRGRANSNGIWWFPAPHALPVAPALPVAFLLARRRLPVAVLRLPLRPLPGRLPAPLAAITLARLPGMKALLASFQQTTPTSWPACPSLPPTGLLIFGMTCRILGRAHGR